MPQLPSELLPGARGRGSGNRGVRLEGRPPSGAFGNRRSCDPVLRPPPPPPAVVPSVPEAPVRYREDFRVHGGTDRHGPPGVGRLGCDPRREGVPLFPLGPAVPREGGVLPPVRGSSSRRGGHRPDAFRGGCVPGVRLPGRAGRAVPDHPDHAARAAAGRRVPPSALRRRGAQGQGVRARRGPRFLDGGTAVLHPFRGPGVPRPLREARRRGAPGDLAPPGGVRFVAAGGDGDPGGGGVSCALPGRGVPPAVRAGRLPGPRERRHAGRPLRRVPGGRPGRDLDGAGEAGMALQEEHDARRLYREVAEGIQ